MAEPPTKRARVDYKDLIQVLVGLDEVEFHVYKGTITIQSPFFRTALASGFKEATERRLRLPECEPDVFNMYLAYIYKEDDQLLSVNANQDTFPGTEAALLRATALKLANLYILADRVGNLRLCNDIVDNLAKVPSFEPGFEIAELIYKTFPSEHKMRLFVVELYRDQGSRTWLRAFRDSLPRDFVLDLASTLLDYAKIARKRKSRKSLPPKVGEGDACRWHQHDEEFPERYCNAAK